MKITAQLYPQDGLYTVMWNGAPLVSNSRDPECDSARALLAKGITGTLTLCDGKTGIPRTIIDIEKAAKLGTREGRCARYFTPTETAPETPSSPETASPGQSPT